MQHHRHSLLPTDELDQAAAEMPSAADSDSNVKKDLAFLGYTPPRFRRYEML